ncbi:histidine kinase [Ophiostoma piceae UAMH 11346]|uniref:Histidine kinase n=1 Tax=Ophiostoma piceae (strain UAMH 11346) TaxID=1262450 RepID=S3CC73_OPHP1|nr:histidine kinase [Ophiostoma piceae UAMH 11346]
MPTSSDVAATASTPAPDVFGSAPVPLRLMGPSKETESVPEDSTEPCLDAIFDLSPVCSVILSPSYEIKRASPRLWDTWGLDSTLHVGRNMLSVLEESAIVHRDDQNRITQSLETAIDSRVIQTLSGQCQTAVPARSSAVDIAWSVRIIPVYRADTLLTLVLEWTQTELPLSASTASTPPTRPALVQPASSTTAQPLSRQSSGSQASIVISDDDTNEARTGFELSPVNQDLASGVSADEYFRILIQTVRDYAIFLLDVNGNIVTWNAGAELNKGYSHDEIIGKHFSIFYSPEDIKAKKPEKELEDCLRDGRVEEEGWRIRKDGSRFWANVTVTAVYKDGVHVGYGKVTRNMTDRRAAELRVVAAYEESAKLKSDFLANMSHEIRTPMHGMLSACSLLLDTQLAPDQREIASIIDESGQVLLRVINDILDYSKLASGSFSIHTDIIGVASIAAAVVRSVQSTLKSNVRLQLSLASDLPRAVQGDPLRYRQILLNIVGNATKFTDKGCISVASSVQEHGEDTFIILTKVTDTGIGIPEDAVSTLFVPFTQVDGTTRKRFPGTGLGLSICKSLVELMGGEIGYEPNPEGQGSVFWFTARFLKIKSLSQLHKPDNESPAQHLQLGKTLSPPGKQLSLFECERNATIPPPLGRIAKKTGLSKAEVASGSGFDLIEDDGFPLSSPLPGDPLADYMFNSAASASSSESAMTTPSSEEGPASSSDVSPMESLCESVTPAKPPTPFASTVPEGETTMCSLTASKSVASVASQTRSITLPVRKGSADSSDEAVEDSKEKLKREFEKSLALLRERAPKKRLLVAEDNATNQRVLTRILKDFHFSQENVVLVSNGAEAVAQAQEQPNGFNLCLMDINMPVVDGYEATVRIRKMGNSIPIMAMTAHALQGDREQCLAYGMNDYVAKPVNKRMLVEKLLAWLPE